MEQQYLSSCYPKEYYAGPFCKQDGDTNHSVTSNRHISAHFCAYILSFEAHTLNEEGYDMFWIHFPDEKIEIMESDVIFPLL